MMHRRYNTLALLVPMILAIGAVFFFAHPAGAETPCLRGGSGNCVELDEFSPVTSFNKTSPLGGSTADSFFVLSDGTYAAVVAERTAPDSYLSALWRYELQLFISNDLGQTWQKVNVTNKGQWYVDEILVDAANANNAMSPSKYYGSKLGAGFLGFSVATRNQDDHEIIAITHTSVCSAMENGTYHETILFNDDFSDSGSAPKGYDCALGDLSYYTDGVVFLDVVSYDSSSKTFSQIDRTRSITRSTSKLVYTQADSGTRPGFWQAVGASHPDVAIGLYDDSNKQWDIWASFNGYVGDICALAGEASCVRQDGSGPIGTRKSELWTRWIRFDEDTVLDGSTGSHISSNALLEIATKDLGEYAEGEAGNAARHAFYSSMSVLTFGGNAAPAIFYGYSDPGTNGYANPDDAAELKWRSFASGAWSAPQNVKDAVSWKNNQTPAHLYAAVDSKDGADGVQTVITPSFSAVTSPYIGWYDTFDYTLQEILHITSYADVQMDSSGKPTGVPVYMRLFNDNANTSWTSIHGLYLGNKLTGMISRIPDSTADCSSVPGECVKAYVESGGPTIGITRNESWIAVPGARTSSFDAQSADVFFLTLRPVAETATWGSKDWSSAVSSSWADFDPSNPDIPIYGQLTENDPGTLQGIASPNLAKRVQSIDSEARTSILSNIFSPIMLFVRAKNDVTSNCSGSTCDVAMSAERNMSGIRGWAWSDTIGWVSMSCDNLKSCYKRSYGIDGTAWSSREGGSYYGVRAVTNSAFEQNTLLGKMWSERIGYISFNRADSVSATNPCGNPPEGYQMTYNDTTRHCARLQQAVGAPDSVNFVLIEYQDGDIDSKFPDRGSILVDDEVMFYNVLCTGSGTARYNGGTITDTNCSQIGQLRLYDSSTPTASDPVKRGSQLTNIWFKSITRAHAENTPVFWIFNVDITHPTYEGKDIYKGIAEIDLSTLETTGWARAENWRDYQATYCPSGVGEGQTPPCDKEWGWLKLDGLWETVHQGNFELAGSCSTNTIHVTSIDGYPEPSGGVSEYVYIPFSSGQTEWPYSAINRVGKYFEIPAGTLPSGATCNSANGKAVQWMTTITGGGIFATGDTIPVVSVSGFNSSGKALMSQDKNGDGDRLDPGEIEVIEYEQVDTTSTPPKLEFVTRGRDGTTAQDFNDGARITQVNTSGTYQVFALPVAENALEKSLAGFAWSAPNTDVPTADPFSSRYSNNISGFGWLNFQPNKLEQIYPYLQTLFNDVYVGGDVDIIGPPNAVSPSQYTATYLLQSNGIIKSFTGDQNASSGQYQQCYEGCGGDTTCIDQCKSLFLPSSAPDISLEPSSGSVFGRLPNIDALSTWVSGCRNYDGELVDSNNDGTPDGGCPEADDQARHISIDGGGILSNDPNNLDPNLAMSGINKYGQHVVLCRPPTDIGYPDSTNIFGDGGYVGNPPECDWQLSNGWWNGELTEDFDKTTDDYMCVNVTSGTMQDAGTLYFGDTYFTDDTIDYQKVEPAVHCASGIELSISGLTVYLEDSYSAGTSINDYDLNNYYKVRHSSLGLPLIYIIPEQFGPDGFGYINFLYTPLQFNNGDAFLDWDDDSDGAYDDPLPDGNIENGAVTFILPGGGFMMDSVSRYCPEGQENLPCKAPEDQVAANEISNIYQLSSVGWLVNGPLAFLSGFNRSYPDNKVHYLGAYLLFLDEENHYLDLFGLQSPFIAPFILGRSLQYNFHGLVIAPNYLLMGEYYVQDADGNVIEPSENFIYDGRVLLNPPPGFEDLSTGLPTIQQAIP